MRPHQASRRQHQKFDAPALAEELAASWTNGNMTTVLDEIYSLPKRQALAAVALMRQHMYIHDWERFAARLVERIEG